MTLKYMLDTNICIYIIKQKPLSVVKHFEKLAIGTVGMSMITYGELFYGAQKSHSPKKTLSMLQELSHLIPSLPMPTDASDYYGLIRSKLEKQGKIIGNNNLWIASHALSLGLTLVTNNTKEFSRIAGLKIVDWVTTHS